ncbi:P-loop containing nucleoside triphosphate hydrolase protein [Mycena capillaripes]|nr:P-loop containing nucleoside triphosphate hydrolase protein [Mycena capillaripes]
MPSISEQAHHLLTSQRPWNLTFFRSLMRMPGMDQWRITVLGDAGVGRTALIVTFILLGTSTDFGPITEEDYRRQFVIDNQMCFVEIFDRGTQATHGPPGVDQCTPQNDAFILIYSVTARSSFDRIERIHRAVMELTRRDTVFVLVGNRCDCKENEREVSKIEGTALAQRLGCEFIETSAKTAQNVQRAFDKVIRRLRQTREGLAPGLEKKIKIKKCNIF